MSRAEHVRVSHHSVLRRLRRRYARYWPLVPIGLILMGLAVAGAILVFGRSG